MCFVLVEEDLEARNNLRLKNRVTKLKNDIGPGIDVNISIVKR